MSLVLKLGFVIGVCDLIIIINIIIINILRACVIRSIACVCPRPFYIFSMHYLLIKLAFTVKLAFTQYTHTHSYCIVHALTSIKIHVK